MPSGKPGGCFFIKKDRKKKMRKRTRKKWHLKEFQEFGCESNINLDPTADFDEFVGDFVVNAVENNGMRFGGGGNVDELEGYIELGKRKVYLQNLEILKKWLDNHPSVIKWTLSPLEDAWNEF